MEKKRRRKSGGIIYGLRNKRTGRFDYVGSTCNLRARTSGHFHSKRSPFYGKVLRYDVISLRWIGWRKRTIIEHRIIRSLAQRGQCKFNVRLERGSAVKHVRTGRVWETKVQARKGLGIGTTSMRTKIRNGELVSVWP